MFSAVHEITDIAKILRYVRFVPNSEVVGFGVARLVHDVGASPRGPYRQVRKVRSPDLIPTPI
jgi:hypothetical protein